MVGMEPCKFVLYLPILKLEIAKNPNANHGILLPFMSTVSFKWKTRQLVCFSVGNDFQIRYVWASKSLKIKIPKNNNKLL